MDKPIEVNGVKYKNLTEKQINDLRTTAKLSQDPTTRDKASQVLAKSQITSNIIQREHDAGSFKRDTGKFATSGDIPIESPKSKSFDYSKEVLDNKPSQSTLSKVTSKIGKGLKVAGKIVPGLGALAALSSGDIMASVPVLGSVDEVGKGSDKVAKSKEEKLNMEKEAKLNMARQIEESKKKKPTKNIFDQMKEKLK